MSVKPSLVTQLSQRMVLTPQLRQRIEMLQMTKLELSDLVTQQLGENPVLDEVQPEETSVAPELSTDDLPEPPAMLTNGAAEMPPEALGGENLGGETQVGETMTGDPGQREMVRSSSETESLATGEQAPQPAPAEVTPPEGGEAPEGDRERDSFEEIDFGSTFEEYLDPGYRTRETEVKESPSFEQFLSSVQHLSDYLLWQ